MFKSRFTISLIFLLVLLLSACSQTQQGTSPQSTESAATTQPADMATLRMALLPILDNLPMYVAQQEGLFEKHNVKVEFIPPVLLPTLTRSLPPDRQKG
jgi:ABC-type nitrate/sulfonate/bicarbonate transport system substrate-binding protein